MNEYYSIIKLLLNKTLYNKYKDYLPQNHIKENYPETYRIIKSLDSLHTGVYDVYSVDDLELSFYTNYPNSNKDSYKPLFEFIRNSEAKPEFITGYLDGLRRRSIATDLARASLRYADGTNDDDTTLERTIQDLSSKLYSGDADEISSRTDEDFVTDDLEKLYNEKILTKGLRWRLESLNKSLGSLRNGDFGFIFARPECFAKGTKIILANGHPIEIEKIISGMKVMGPDSKSRHVIATSRGEEDMYRVSYPWGDSYVCNESHVLQLRAEGQITTQVRVKDYLNWSKKLKHRFKQYKVGIDIPYRQVKLDPYILGLWLGDGTSSAPHFTNADEEVINYLQAWANDSNLVCKIYERTGQGLAKTISISSKTRKHGSNTFLQYLKSTRLLKNKHIPTTHLYNSRDVRLALLAGLIDTDGHREGTSLSFCNKNEKLINQVIWLCRSLGLHATKRKKIVNDVVYYVIGIYGACWNVPVKIKRKKVVKPQTKPKRNGLNFGFKITKEPDEKEYYGIQVDQDSLYLLDDFTVVHNTGKTTFLASEVTHMATQCERPIIWFNNEEQSGKVMIRCIQAVLGLRLEQLHSDIKSNSEKYHSIMKGRLRIYDGPAMTKREVEDICEKHNPSMMIFDQIDKIKGTEAERYDLQMKAIYQWARELSKKYGPVIGVCQAGGTGDGKKWLTMNDVDSSHTAKQGEADWMLGIGKTYDNGLEEVRYMHLCKNKLEGDIDTDPAMRHGKFEVRIQPEIARYSDF